MFTGIIRHIGEVTEIQQQTRSAVLMIRNSLFASSEVKVGDSIAVDGVCLTVVRKVDECALFDVSSETLRRTTLGALQSEQKVNLELALRFGDKVDGHLVQGHVDGVATLLKKITEGETERFDFTFPAELAPFIASKGSVTLQGVSLTVCDVSETHFSVYIIPHTLRETTLSILSKNSKVNLEVDCLARYVDRLLTPYKAILASGTNAERV